MDPIWPQPWLLLPGMYGLPNLPAPHTDRVGTQGQALSGATLSCRRWHTDLPRGACLLISISVEHDKLPVEGGVKAIVLTSQYLIEPSAMGRSKVTHICRADLR